MFRFRLACLILFLAAVPVLRAQDANGQAIDALKSGDLSTAESVLRSHLRTEPSDAISLQILAIVLDKEKKYAEADTFYRRALATAPHSPGLLNNYGNHLLAMGRIDAARKTFLEVLALDPAHANAKKQLAHITELQSRPAEALYSEALADIAKHDKQSALELLVRARKIAPDRTDIAALLARTTAALGYFADAIQAWDAYLKLAPHDQIARRERAFAEAALGNDQEAALAELKKFAQAHPSDAVGHYELGTAESTADPSAALAELNRALAIDPKLAPAHFARGLLRYRKSDIQAAAADFAFTVKAQPENAAALDRLAEMDLALNRTGEALPLLRKAASLAPENARVQLHLGQALTKAGKRTEAAEALRRYRELNSGQESVPHAAGLLAFLGLSPAEQYAQYRAGVERAVKKNPQNAEAQVRYLGILLNAGDLAGARAVCGRLAMLHPTPQQLREAANELRAAGQYALAQSLQTKTSPH